MPAKMEKVTYYQVNLTACQFEQVASIIRLKAEDVFNDAFYGDGFGNGKYLQSLLDLSNALGKHKEIELSEAD